MIPHRVYFIKPYWFWKVWVISQSRRQLAQSMQIITAKLSITPSPSNPLLFPTVSSSQPLSSSLGYNSSQNMQAWTPLALHCNWFQFYCPFKSVLNVTTHKILMFCALYWLIDLSRRIMESRWQMYPLLISLVFWILWVLHKLWSTSYSLCQAASSI